MKRTKAKGLSSDKRSQTTLTAFFGGQNGQALERAQALDVDKLAKEFSRSNAYRANVFGH